MKAAAAVLCVTLTPALGLAQTPDNGASHMVRAAGMPLNDGTLAPGVLTVRIVEGAFTRDIAGQRVDVQVSGGKTESSQTGPDGRAMFAHVPVGARVHASAVVGTERLESEAFEMPATSGVRVLLVAGSAGDPATSTLPPNHPWIGSASQIPQAAPERPPDGNRQDDLTIVFKVLASITVVACALFFWNRHRQSVAVRSAPRSPSDGVTAVPRPEV